MSELDFRSTDFTSDPQSAPRARSPGRPKRRWREYVRRHWRGELTLSRSFWINTMALSAALLLFELGGLMLIYRHPPVWALVILIVVIYGTLRLLVATWQVVGTLRATALLENRWSALVNVLMAAVILAVLGEVIAFGWEIDALSKDALLQLLTARYQVGVSSDGQSVVGSGTLGPGYTAAVERAFSQHPQIHRFQLDSVWGDTVAAAHLRNFFASRPDIAVEVDGYCGNGCLIAFTGATQRIVGPQAQVFFSPPHAIDDLGLASGILASIQQQLRQRLIQLGATGIFIGDAANGTVRHPYVPDITTLFAHGIVTAVRLKQGLMDGSGWHVEQFLFALRANPKLADAARAMDVIQNRYPAIFNKWLSSDLETRYVPGERERSWRYMRALTLALDTGSREALKSMPDVAVEELAVRRRDQLAKLSREGSPDGCGRYLREETQQHAGERVDLFLLNAAQTTLAAHDSSPPSAAPYDPVKGVFRLEDTRNAVRPTLPFKTGESPYAEACIRETTLIDRLAATHSSDDVMALRFLFINDGDSSRVPYLFGP